ncbi:TIR domain-containing protein [Bacillus mycoides]|uniref:TIR domain-containing protein n=1 Tax=Bacillus mycoides TaxID=1405 RepID=UPI003D9E3AB4
MPPKIKKYAILSIESKEELEELFDSSTEVFNRSENENRSTMSEDTIQEYLYEKLKKTSVTIVLLTPKAVSYQKDIFGSYDDWFV